MRIESIVSTTRVDSQGERMSREALQSLVDSISNAYIPVGIEHDPRIPPQGRMDSGYVREAADGEFEAVAILEFFEQSDESEVPKDKRDIVTSAHRTSGLTISHDFTHRSNDDQADINSIAEAFQNEPIYDIKKAVDPISVITICGAFVLGGIATGLLGQIGVDAWSLVKRKLGNLFERKEVRNGEQLLVFNALVEANSNQVEISVILTNPTPEEMESFLTNGLKIVDKVAPIYLQNSPEVRRLTFEACGDRVELLFAVRKDCRPLTFKYGVSDILERIGSS